MATTLATTEVVVAITPATTVEAMVATTLATTVEAITPVMGPAMSQLGRLNSSRALERYNQSDGAIGRREYKQPISVTSSIGPSTNGSLFPHDAGLYNWTSTGANHTWNHTWNVSAGYWCLSAIESEFVHCIQCNDLHDSWFRWRWWQWYHHGTFSPTGWDVRWMNSTLHNMSAGEVRTSTLRISVPNGETGDYGFLLSAGSAFGNFSISKPSLSVSTVRTI